MGQRQAYPAEGTAEAWLGEAQLLEDQVVEITGLGGKQWEGLIAALEDTQRNLGFILRQRGPGKASEQQKGEFRAGRTLERIAWIQSSKAVL